ncbi:unnamed protein product [Symbiodinium natans]|uniref:Uncharacterized protein n=1 Tax=Symbiodinium natans TaxID=878477 RepID=A0A812I4P2_9DINO|nr:unnamed protein product [Symbiodinium natans]
MEERRQRQFQCCTWGVYEKKEVVLSAPEAPRPQANIGSSLLAEDARDMVIAGMRSMGSGALHAGMGALELGLSGLEAGMGALEAGFGALEGRPGNQPLGRTGLQAGDGSDIGANEEVVRDHADGSQ